MSTEQIDQRRACAFIRNVRHVNGSHALEQFTRHIRRTAQPTRTIIKTPRLRARQRNQFTHCFHRHRGMHRQQLRGLHDQRHGGEIADDVIGHFPDEEGRYRVLAGRQQQGIAVSRRARHQLGPDHGITSGTVVDHHLLPEQFAQTWRECPCQHVRTATGRDRYHPANHAVWIRLRLRKAGIKNPRH